jgi:hypothetical protein
MGADIPASRIQSKANLMRFSVEAEASLDCSHRADGRAMPHIASAAAANNPKPSGENVTMSQQAFITGQHGANSSGDIGKVHELATDSGSSETGSGVLRRLDARAR